MKKLVALLVLLFAFVAAPVVANADPYDHHDRGYHDGYDHDRGPGPGAHGYGPHGFHEGIDGHGYHYFGPLHGWIWGFPPPVWFLPGVTQCSEYYTSDFAGYNAYGQPVYVETQHVECLQGGIWIFIH